MGLEQREAISLKQIPLLVIEDHKIVLEHRKVLKKLLLQTIYEQGEVIHLEDEGTLVLKDLVGRIEKFTHDNAIKLEDNVRTYLDTIKIHMVSGDMKRLQMSKELLQEMLFSLNSFCKVHNLLSEE